MNYTIYQHFYELKKEGLINQNWILNTHDNTIWNIETGNKLFKNQWTNFNWNKDIN